MVFVQMFSQMNGEGTIQDTEIFMVRDAHKIIW